MGGGAQRAEPPWGGRRRNEAPERERPRPKRLSYREQREWDGIEQAILDAEGAAGGAPARGGGSGHRVRPAALQQRYAALEAARAEVDRLYERWAELEAKQEA